MKKNWAGLIVFTGVFMFTAYTASSQHYVRARPAPPPPAVRPPMPRQGYVWVGEEWRWSHGRYIYAPGRWVAAPYRGAIWIPGRWVQSRYGWRWVPGHWRRR